MPHLKLKPNNIGALMLIEIMILKEFYFKT